MTWADTAIVAVTVISVAGVIVRPFRFPEAIWACGGALILVLMGLLSLGDAAKGIGKGTDVYLFLVGMMLIAEAGRAEGLFDWLAERAVRHSAGSPRKLFAAVYAVGTVVTIFLSNDATAVVLTPAVYAAAKAANAKPLPYLLICAFIANAASFVLPISNPANLVVYGADMPSLPEWLATFGLPSISAIVATYVVLRLTQRKELQVSISLETKGLALSRGGKFAAWGICLTALVLISASFLNLPLGMPTFVTGIATTGGILWLTGTAPSTYSRNISWGVLPLVAGLFMLVEALDRTGLVSALAQHLNILAGTTKTGAMWGGGILAALASNLANNLPVGLLAGAAAQVAHPSAQITGALLIGVDLGPNLSVTGSLATILWLAALRREGLNIGAWQFLRIGALAMPAALAVALATLILAR